MVQNCQKGDGQDVVILDSSKSMCCKFQQLFRCLSHSPAILFRLSTWVAGGQGFEPSSVAFRTALPECE